MERNQVQITKFLKLIMVATGTWRHKLTNNKFAQNFYTLYAVMFQISYLYFFIALVLNFPLLLRNADYEVMIESLGYILVVFITVTKIVMSQSSKVQNLILRCIIEEIRMYKEDSEAIQHNYQENVKVLNRAILVLLLLSSSMLSIFWSSQYVEYITYKDLNISIHKPTEFPIWYPFNTNDHYGAAITFVLCFGWLSTCNLVCTQILFYTLMAYAILQIKALKISAMEFLLYSDPCNNTVEYNGGKQMFSVLRKICVKHQSIISFVEELNTAIKNILLLEFILNSLNIAATMVQLIIPSTAGHLLAVSVFYFFLQIYQLFLLSWYTNEIQLESMSVSETLFHSMWYDQSENVKKIIYVIMIRSRKPLSLFIGPFYPMTNSTALSTLKAAYSYVAMILTLAAKEQVS